MSTFCVFGVAVADCVKSAHNAIPYVITTTKNGIGGGNKGNNDIEA